MTDVSDMDKPQPRVTALDRPFWDGLIDRRLMLQRCRNESCRRWVFYPRVCCPFCHADSLEWAQASGRGRIVSHTTVRRPHHAGFDAEVPYVFAAVELEERPCIFAQIQDAPIDGRSLAGRGVAADFVRHGPQRQMLVFRLEPDR